MTLIGDPGTFAIEYEIELDYPVFGIIQIWLDAKRFGDINQSNPLFHLCSSLEAMMIRDPAIPAVYSRRSDVPSDEALLSASWSWGPSFDDFLFALYAVQDESLLHFVWKLGRETDSFIDYPSGLHHASVPFAIYDRAVGEFLTNLHFRKLPESIGVQR